MSWTKDGSTLHSEGRLLIRSEGERHTLLLREARAADAGSYTATATNELGQASCASTLAVRPGREPSRLGPGWGELWHLLMNEDVGSESLHLCLSTWLPSVCNPFL